MWFYVKSEKSQGRVTLSSPSYIIKVEVNRFKAIFEVYPVQPCFVADA